MPKNSKVSLVTGGECPESNSPGSGQATTIELNNTDTAYTVIQEPTQTPLTKGSSSVKPVCVQHSERLKVDQNIVEQRSHAASIKGHLDCPIRRIHNNDARMFSGDFMHAKPTTTEGPGLLLDVDCVSPASRADESSPKLQEMEVLISELSTHFPEHRPRITNSQISGEVVLLTGSTGALGSQLLAYLASLPDVSRIYALNRRSKDGTPLRARQKEAFLQRDLAGGIIDSPKVILVEGDASKNDVDISLELYNEIRDNITLIVHNAWKVNILSKLASFEPNIRSVRTLIDLALESPRQNPPRIIYTSSVSVYKNWNAEKGRPMEAPIHDPTMVLGSGYSESKYVGERILESAAKSTPLRPVIVRIGQLTSNYSGAWNATDLAPLMVIKSQSVGALPARDDNVAWLSLEIAAEAIYDFRNSESQYLNLAHPNPAPWRSLFEIFSKGLNVPLIGWAEWKAKLEKFYGIDDAVVRILDVFRECCHSLHMENREGLGLPLMDMRQALNSSARLARSSLPKTGPEDAERWLRYWRRMGLLKNNAPKL